VGVLLGAAALLAAAPGCASPEPCAGVGVTSGVAVMFQREGSGAPAGASYELCTRGECVKGVLPEEDVTRLNLRLPDDVDPDRSPVRLRVRREDGGDPVVDASLDVKLERQSDGCGGGAWNRGLSYTEAGGLVPEIPRKLHEAWLRQLDRRGTEADG
jgi:hypothetical protein